MEGKCGENGCLVDRLEAQFDKGIRALQENQQANMVMLREVIEKQLDMVNASVSETKRDSREAFDEMFQRLRSLELQVSAHVTDAQVRLMLSDALAAQLTEATVRDIAAKAVAGHEDVKSVARFRASVRRVAVGVAIISAIPLGAFIVKAAIWIHTAMTATGKG